MERFTVEPSVGIYNLFNFANFNLLPEVMSGLLNGSTQSLNGTTAANQGVAPRRQRHGRLLARFATATRIRLALNLLG